MTELDEQPTDPSRVGTHLEGDAQRCAVAECPGRLGGGAHPRTLDRFAGGVDEAHRRVAVADVEAGGEGRKRGGLRFDRRTSWHDRSWLTLFGLRAR
ncbi:MAG: hypothetical protein U0610_20405 [bacterium]